MTDTKLCNVNLKFFFYLYQMILQGIQRLELYRKEPILEPEPWKNLKHNPLSEP